MIGRWLLRLWGIDPEPEYPKQSDETYACPTCGHEHVTGVYRLGRLYPLTDEAVQSYVEGRIGIRQLEAALDRVAHLEGRE